MKGSCMAEGDSSLQNEFLADAAKMVLNLAQRCRGLNAGAAKRTLDEAEARLAKEYELHGVRADKARELAAGIISQARALVVRPRAS